MVNYGPIVYWCCGQRGQRAGDFTKEASGKVGCGWERESTLRIHVLQVADFVLWEQMEPVAKECQSKDLQSGQYSHMVKNLIQTTLWVQILTKPRAQTPKEGQLSFRNRLSNYSSRMLLERILLGNPRNQLMMSITLSLDGLRPGWDAQWSDLG